MIRFKVKPEEGIVTAEFVSAKTGEPISWFDEIQKQLMNTVFSQQPWIAKCKGLWKDVRTSVAGVNTVAVAHCHESDAFDENIGKEIAKARLLLRWDNVTYDSIHLVKKRVREELENVTNSANFALSGMWQSFERHQKELQRAYERVDEEDIEVIG